jgi:hypothetical protein
MTMTADRPRILAVKSGRNARRDNELIGELSNAGKAWRNSTGSFHGEPVGPGDRVPTGKMPEDEAVELRVHTARHAVDYVIFSYSTPIAYRVTTGSSYFWIITDTRYSNTTSQQVGKLWVLTQERYGYTGVNPV